MKAINGGADMTLVEYYKKNVSKDICKIDSFHISINMIPDRKTEEIIDKAVKAQDEKMPVIEDDFYYYDDWFDVVTFENGEKKFYYAYGTYDHSLEENTDIKKWLEYGKYTYDVGDEIIDEQ